MLQIRCPYCGTRDEVEFEWGGAAHVVRPSPSASDAEWSDYLYGNSNTKGDYSERWFHGYGCGQWFNAIRNTVTHEIGETYEMGGEPR